MTSNKLSSAAEKLIADREVDPATVKQYLTAQTEGKRKVERQLDRYKSLAKDGAIDNSVIKKYLTTANDGKQYKVKHCDLQAIRSVLYMQPLLGGRE